MPEVAKYFHNHNVTKMPHVKKSRHMQIFHVG